MNTYRLLSPLHRIISLAVVMLAALMLFYGAKVVLSAGAQQEREIEDQVPKHLPIEVKIKNSDKVKNLDNENWVRDLEIEVKNKSDKPIYFLNLYVVLPEVKSSQGNTIGFPIRYGRIEFITFDTPVISEDVPILPGGLHVFNFGDKQVRGWGRFASEQKLTKGEPKKIQIIFASLSFGDGTGFDTTGGLPINIHRERTSNIFCSASPLSRVRFMLALFLKC